MDRRKEWRRFQARAYPALEFAPGVVKTEWGRGDEYVGTIDALVSASLAKWQHFPGMPGMRKLKVRIDANGVPIGGPPTAFTPRIYEPGASLIERAGATRFRITVNLSAEENAARWQRMMEMDEAFRALCVSSATPAPTDSSVRRNSHLRLVYDSKVGMLSA